MKSIALVALLLVASPAVAQPRDMVDVASAVLTPAVQLPIVTGITRIDVMPNGFRVEFDKREGINRWPDVVPAGWDGPIEFTLWLGAKLNDGRWHIAASMNIWNGDGVGASNGFSGGTGTDPKQYSQNLYYLDGALGAHTPIVGELLCAFVTAGAQRGLNAFAVEARSNVITFALPTAAGASFVFTYDALPPPEVPPVVPPVVTEPPPPTVPPVVPPIVTPPTPPEVPPVVVVPVVDPPQPPTVDPPAPPVVTPHTKYTWQMIVGAIVAVLVTLLTGVGR